MEINDVLDFWLSELDPKQRWVKDPELDRKIESRFLSTLTAATNGELHSWRSSPKGRLAEIIVLDQFSRNIFRGKPESFAQDAQALTLTQEALNVRAHKELSPTEVSFLIMPVMHSESKAIHHDFLKYFEVPGLEDTLDFELRHKAIIDEFGRYPHRNKILSRSSTPKELEFLKQPGSSF